ncbi:unnamed protein product [Somion occarium]|uniref:ER membrane protein complex subunit 10 n=1 Tax=Somion occarium TaxID=3059160 RepID=A0ABP1CY18_9APHY
MLLLLLFLPLVLAADTSLRILHRVYHPKVPGIPFTERGSLLLSRSGPFPQVSLVPSEMLSTDLLEFAQTLHDADAYGDSALYQVALEHEGDKDQSQWDVSSVKACHLQQSFSESITLHVSSGGTPYAIDYFVGPIPHNGACPKHRPVSKTSPETLAIKPITNTTVLLSSPRSPPQPQLRAPPPLTTEGKVVEPVPEKNFLQKYWIYILVAVLALLLSPAPPEEEAGGNARPGGR